MPFSPHTDQDIDAMLAAIGAGSIEELFDEIPASLRISGLGDVPSALSEMEVSRLMHERARDDGSQLNFIGAGAYEHHIPAAVWQITTRGEFYTAYTPYQAEASQGTLQLIYEYQTMMSRLTGLDVSNASLYDGASAVAEAILMAVRANRKSKSRRILCPVTLHPRYRDTVRTIVSNQGIELVELPFDPKTGSTTLDSFAGNDDQDFAAVIVPQPNFFGMLEQTDRITDWAHARNMLVIGVVNPVALALLKPPGEWGTRGADIACGEGQPLGVPLMSGGPYFGFMTCRKEFVRQMPGRLVGRTVDLDDEIAYTLTLQAREQHIRRSKATSNICTNQGLMVTAATIHMALLGPHGLTQVARACHARAAQLVDTVCGLDGVRRVFSGPFFHEAALTLPDPADQVLERLADQQIAGGYALAADYPELGDALLVCATETRSDADITRYAETLGTVLDRARVA